jgi:hypothetical protein
MQIWHRCGDGPERARAMHFWHRIATGVATDRRAAATEIREGEPHVGERPDKSPGWTASGAGKRSDADQSHASESPSSSEGEDGSSSTRPNVPLNRPNGSTWKCGLGVVSHGWRGVARTARPDEEHLLTARVIAK